MDLSATRSDGSPLRDFLNGAQFSTSWVQDNTGMRNAFGKLPQNVESENTGNVN